MSQNHMVQAENNFGFSKPTESQLGMEKSEVGAFD
jgi:hypothetical protein